MIFATLILWASISMLDIGIGIALPVVSVAFGVLWYYGGDRLIFIVAVMVVVVSLALYLSSYVKQREAVGIEIRCAHLRCRLGCFGVSALRARLAYSIVTFP